MAKIIFIFIGMFFFQADLANAQSCETLKASTNKECSPEGVAAAKAILKQCEVATSTGAATGATGAALIPVTQNCTEVSLPAARTKLEEMVAHCEKARKDCSTTCQKEASAQEMAMAYNAAEAAKTNADFCENGPPKENQVAAQQGLGSIAQILPALLGILSQLGLGKSGDPSTTCATTNSCPTDVASAGSAGTVSSGERPTTTSGYLDPGVVGNDAPIQNANVAPTFAPASTGSGGGSGGSAGAGAGGRSGFSPSSAAALPDNTPKINLAGNSSGGRGGGGGAAMGGSSKSPTVGNPLASRSGIEADPKAMATLEKAMQMRGMASEGPMGGISSALALDNFQKIEKRIQNERNLLNELSADK